MTQTTSHASITDFVRLSRPRQWTKNVLVAAAPFAAGVLDQSDVIAAVLLGFVAFCLVSSGLYAINDARDADADRLHPKKRHRPVAAGRISPNTAVLFGAGLIVAGLAAGPLTGEPRFAAILVLYATMIIAYSFGLKQVALVDVGVIALGFLLRALSGAVLADVPVSVWFFMVTAFGALFIAAGKRYGDRQQLGADAEGHRAALEDYAPGFIELLLGVSAAVVLMAYGLWAFEIQGDDGGIPWAGISIIPFVAAVLRYAQLVFLDRGGEPETLLYTDRGLQAALAVWMLTAVPTFYGGSS